ncbi:MAG: efflux RND transporter periplasmic adaptor subunit [Verrucomicrobiota bacterium]
MKLKNLKSSDSKPSRKPASRIFIVLGIVAVLSAAVFINILLKATAPEPKQVEVTNAIPSVRVMQVEQAAQTLSVTTQGTVEPRTETTLVSEVAGKVMEVSSAMDAGAFFRKGDILLKIDERDYQTALVSAIAQVAQAEAELATEKAEAEQARIDWERLGNGREPSDLLLRVPQLVRAEAALASARAAVEKARHDLERTTIKAPYDGRTRNKMAETGQFVTAGSQLGRVFATDYVEIRLPLSDEQLGKLDPAILTYRQTEWQDGPAVTLQADVAGRSRQWNGRITHLEGVVDSKSRFYYAIARVDDPYGKTSVQGAPLTVGMFVEAEINGRQVENVAQIPRSAIHPGNRVYVINNQEQLQIRNVEIVSQSKDSALVGAGLQDGEYVAITPLATPVEGMTLKIAETPPPANAEITRLKP